MNTLGEYVSTQLPDGAILSPGLFFTSEPGLGIYRKVTGTSSAMSFCQNGVDCMIVSQTGCSTITPVTGSVYSGNDGTQTAPTFSFTSDLKTGMYKSGTNKLGFTAGGTKMLDVSSSSSTFSSPCLIIDGSSTSPGLALSSASNTGIYRGGAATLGFSSNGSQVFRMGPVVAQCDVAFQTGTNALATGNITCNSIFGTGDWSNGINLMTTGALTSGSIVALGPITCGSFPMTSGDTSVSSINSTSTIPISISASKVIDFKSVVGPVVIARSQLNTVCSPPSSGATNFALHFGTQAGTMTSNYITSTPSAVNGDIWTIVQPGFYIFRMGGMTAIAQTGGAYVGCSRNVTGTTTVLSWTQAQTIGLRFLNGVQDIVGTTTWSGIMAAGDVVRCCAGIVTTLISLSSTTWFEIIYVTGMDTSL